jgi:hypothetical protein
MAITKSTGGLSMNKTYFYLLLLPLCTNLFAQTRDCSLVGQWAHGTTYTAEMRDGILYYGNGGYLDMADVSMSVAHPVLLGRWLSPGPVHEVAVRGDYAYVACGGPGLRIVNISDPAHPVETGAIPVNYKATSVALNSSTAYVADKYYGLRIVDIENPEVPVETAYFYLDYVDRVAYANGYVYLTAEHHGFYVFDVSDPAAPVLTDSSGSFYVTDVAVKDNWLYVGCSDSLSLFSLSDPAHPEFIMSFGDEIYFQRIFIDNDIAYVTETYKGLIGFDISDPSNPAELFRLNPGEDYGYSCFVCEGIAYIAMESFGVKIIDVSDPAAVQVLGGIPTGAKSRNVAVKDRTVFITQGDAGLRVLDISNPAEPVETGWYDPPVFGYDISISENIACLSQSNDGPTLVLDISDPAHPDSLGQIEGPNIRYSNDCKIIGNMVYLAMGSRGFGIADLSDPAHPAEIGTCDTPGRGYRLDVSGNYAYMADYDSLIIIDISDPANPVRAAAIAGRDEVYDVAVREPYAYVADYYEGLTVVDISDPLHPVIAGYKDTQRAVRVELKNNVAYIGDYGNGVTLLDISDPVNPEFLGRYDTPSAAEGVAVDDRGYICVTDMEDGLYIVQYDGASGISLIDSDLCGFQLPSNFPNPFNPVTSVTYTVPVRATVELNVYNIHGALVARLDRGEKETGRYTVVWNGRDLGSRPVPGGVYLCRLKSGDFVTVIRMVLVK